jgi:hypothetical protein
LLKEIAPRVTRAVFVAVIDPVGGGFVDSLGRATDLGNMQIVKR